MASTPTDSHDCPTRETFERSDEYKAVLNSLVALDRNRQNVNDVFVAVNTVFLTGLGIALLTTQLDKWSWWLVAEVGFITLATTPINLTWRSALQRYKSQTAHHVDYMMSIENEFRQRRQAISGELPKGEVPIGFFLYKTSRRRPRSGNVRLEMRLAAYFLLLYPGVTLFVATLTCLVADGRMTSLLLNIH